jgi:hypothetical protein
MDIAADGFPAEGLTSRIARGPRQSGGRCRLYLFGVVALSALCPVTGAHAAVTYVQSNSVTPGKQSTITATFTGAQTASDLNLVFIGWEDTTSQVSSVSDTSGNVYVLANRNVFPGIGQQVAYYAKNIARASPGVNTVQVAFTAAVPYPDIRIVEYSGLDLVNPLDVAAGSHGRSTLTTSGSVTTTNANDLLVGSNYTNHTTTGPGTPYYTQRLIDSYGEIVEDAIVTAAGSYSATAPQAPRATWYIMQMLALRAAGNLNVSPYPSSAIVGGIAWDASSKQRYSPRSDLWDSMWASDNSVYGAWGDGYGFACSSKRQIGVSALYGSPDSGVLTGIDAFCGAPYPPTCAPNSPIGGKDQGVVALPGAVMYMFHTTQNIRQPNGTCGDITTVWLAKSVDNGYTWTDHVSSLQWPDANGFNVSSILQYGQAQAGGLAPDSSNVQYLYIYGLKLAFPRNAYLARVPSVPSNAIEAPANWSYYAGHDLAGNPTWSQSSADAAPIWSDPNQSQYLVVTFDRAIGRYIAYSDHGSGCAGTPCERQVGLFDAPSPWGPWTTIDYEEQFDNTGCSGNCLGNQPAVGWSMMQKWMSSDGLGIWVEYNSTGAYDSLNLIRGRLSIATGSTLKGISVSTGRPAVLDILSLSNPGNLEYIDSMARFTSIPPDYIGLESLRLANNDSSSSDANYLSFTSTMAQNVCVGWDVNNPVPAWLSTWTNTGNSLIGDATFHVYSTTVAAGAVTLPGPNASDNYIVFVGC